jgi:hypothetical protein
VRVPKEAGVGSAKFKITFASWKAARIEPGTGEIPVVAPDVRKK